MRRRRMARSRSRPRAGRPRAVLANYRASYLHDVPVDRLTIDQLARMRIGVVGAGIIGLAVARRLAELEPDAALTVLEKEPDIALHQTGRNSGVVHAGIYYAPGSLKAQLCRRGVGLLREYCAETAVCPWSDAGSSSSPSTRPRSSGFASSSDVAGANGVPGVRWLDGAELTRDRAARRGDRRSALADDGDHRLSRGRAGIPRRRPGGWHGTPRREGDRRREPGRLRSRGRRRRARVRSSRHLCGPAVRPARPGRGGRGGARHRAVPRRVLPPGARPRRARPRASLPGPRPAVPVPRRPLHAPRRRRRRRRAERGARSRPRGLPNWRDVRLVDVAASTPLAAASDAWREGTGAWVCASFGAPRQQGRLRARPGRYVPELSRSRTSCARRPVSARRRSTRTARSSTTSGSAGSAASPRSATRPPRARRPSMAIAEHIVDEVLR